MTDRLEAGGMAEVFRGESTSVAGFKKQVAIKRVLSHLASNEKFIRMFLDEARLSARLTHTNIVQVFDIGHVENTYFIVMEFIDGLNLKHVIEHLRARHQSVPMHIAAHIASKVCEGLFYAHELTDSEGRPLNIVHRDISPPNVLISKRGEVKITDFGLAKAAVAVEKTEPGVVKGKFSYLSPETALGRDADAQADIFAVGIMLWEMLAGRKLFQGESDYATVKLVQQAMVPSIRSINPAVPEEMERILRVALAKDKRQRYPTAQAMGEELSSFLFSHQLRVTPLDVGRLVSEVVAERDVTKSGLSRKEGSTIETLIQEELLAFTSLGDPSASLGGASGATPNDADGSRPLDAGEFANLNEWSAGLSGDLEGGARQSIPIDLIPSLSPTSMSSPGNLADELEGDGDLSAPLPPPLTPTVHEPLVHNKVFKSLAPPPGEGRKLSTALIAVLAALVVAAVGVGFYLKFNRQPPAPAMIPADGGDPPDPGELR
ncbi:MAG: serine/threonine-protein kinase [Polyangiales bacterium]